MLFLVRFDVVEFRSGDGEIGVVLVFLCAEGFLFRVVIGMLVWFLGGCVVVCYCLLAVSCVVLRIRLFCGGFLDV